MKQSRDGMECSDTRSVDKRLTWLTDLQGDAVFRQSILYQESQQAVYVGRKQTHPLPAAVGAVNNGVRPFDY